MRQVLHVGASLLFIVAVTLACKRSRHHEDDYTTSTPPEVDTETTPTPTVAPTHSATASAHHTTTTASAHTQSAGDAPCPGPGITRRCSGTCVNIQTDDNNCGECGNRCSNGKHCDGHLFCRDSEGNL